jgi:HAD superfamily hydrolase (TIGR01509 family)
MKNAYLFDFDGTLVDSMPTFVSAMLRILDENHIAYDTGVIKVITPLGLNGTADYYINQLGVQMSKEQLMSVMKEYMLDAYFHTIPAKKNVPEVLKALKARGASLNVLTASPHITLDVCLQRLGLWDLFVNIWSCDDFGTTKADPEIYKQAAERMHTSVEQVLFLDDNLDADRTAKAAGVMTCGVYDPSSEAYVDLMKEVNDFYIYDFTELLELEIEKKA